MAQDLVYSFPNVSCGGMLSSRKFEILDLPYREEWSYGLKIVAFCNGIICLNHDDYASETGDDLSVGFGTDVKT